MAAGRSAQPELRCAACSPGEPLTKFPSQSKRDKANSCTEYAGLGYQTSYHDWYVTNVAFISFKNAAARWRPWLIEGWGL